MLISLVASTQSLNLNFHSDLQDLINRNSILNQGVIQTGIQDISAFEAFTEIIKNYQTLSKTDKYIASKLIRNYPEFWHLIPSDKLLGEKEFIDSTATFYTINSTSKNELDDLIKPRRPILKFFYSNPAYLFSVNTDNFLLKANPIIDFSFGNDLSANNLIFNNTRGVELSGHVSNKVFFYSNILETQSAFPRYVTKYINQFSALPGNGLYKNYNSVVFGDNAGYDYLNAQAYINTSLTKNISVEFGNGNSFLGNGKRSLIRSNFTNNHLYLKFTTKVWKFNYQNYYAELIPFSVVGTPGNSLIKRKYNASHYLSFKHNNLEIGLFETVMFSRENGFDLQYLNPIILYRAVEHNLDSSDNVLIGLNVSYIIGNKIKVYGQIMFDEFLLKELILEQNGWWGNKYGLQLGVRYLNLFGVDNLNLRIEYNRVRPYTYGHRDILSYSHANQSWAHPLGANLSELLVDVDFFPVPKFKIQSQNYLINQGLDTPETYYGSDILRPSSERISEFGIDFLQGNSSSTFLSANKFTYEFFHNYYFDLNVIYRNQISDSPDLTYSNFLISTGLRINLWSRQNHF